MSSAHLLCAALGPCAPTALQQLLGRRRCPSAASPAVAYAPMSSGTGKKRSPYKAIVAGGLAGAIEACVSYPTEYIKTNLQLFEEKAKMGPIRCARETIAKDGA